MGLNALLEISLLCLLKGGNEVGAQGLEMRLKRRAIIYLKQLYMAWIKI